MTAPTLTLINVIGSWKRRCLDVFLQWRTAARAPLDHYTIYEQTDKDGTLGPWQKTIRLPGTDATYIRTIPDRGRFNWYITATDEAGNESPPSNTQGMAATPTRPLITNPGNRPA